MQIIFFDTETTNLIANHSVPLTRQPEVIEFYAALVEPKSGDIVAECHHLIRPKSFPLTAEQMKHHKVTNDLIVGAPPFADVAGEIAGFFLRAPAVAAHNLSFDMEMIDIEFERLGQKVEWPATRSCTVEQTCHLAGYRLKLMDLYRFLFEEEFEEAHRAKPDTQAVIRCALELYRREEL